MSDTEFEDAQSDEYLSEHVEVARIAAACEAEAVRAARERYFGSLNAPACTSGRVEESETDKTKAPPATKEPTPEAQTTLHAVIKQERSKKAVTPVEPPTLFDLPNELLAKVFAHLNTMDVLKFANAHRQNRQILHRVNNLSLRTVVVYRVESSKLFLSKTDSTWKQRTQDDLCEVNIGNRRETKHTSSWNQLIDLMDLDIVRNVEIDTTGCDPHVLHSFAKMFSMCWENRRGKVFSRVTVKAVANRCDETFCGYDQKRNASWRGFFETLSSVLPCTSLNIFFDFTCKCKNNCSVGDIVWAAWKNLDKVTSLAGSLGRKKDFFSHCPRLINYANTDAVNDKTMIERFKWRDGKLTDVSLHAVVCFESMDIMQEPEVKKMLDFLQAYPKRMVLLGDWAEEQFRLDFTVTRKDKRKLSVNIGFLKQPYNKLGYNVPFECTLMSGK